MILSVKVKPNSRLNGIIIDADDSITIKITAPPHEGKANEAVVTFLSKTFHIPKSAIKIISGLASRHKRLEFSDEYAKEIQDSLLRYRADSP